MPSWMRAWPPGLNWPRFERFFFGGCSRLTVDSGAMQAVTLTFSAMGLVPGTYQAQLDLLHNTPYAIPRLPVTLTVYLW
jgi:hypothetical protein